MSPSAVIQLQRELRLRGTLIRLDGKSSQFSANISLLETVDRPVVVNRKSQVANRSVSVSMTLSDIEGGTRECRISVITIVPFDQTWHGNTYISRGQLLPYPKGTRPQLSPVFGDDLDWTGIHFIHFLS